MWFKKGKKSEIPMWGVFIDKRRSILKNGRSLSKRKIFTMVIILLIGCTGVYIWGTYRTSQINKQPDNLTEEQEFVNSLTISPNNEESITKLAESYGEKYDTAFKEISSTNPIEWDKAKLDNAYAALLYADKMGAFSQVQRLLSSIEMAGEQGLNIDDNSYGVTQQTRESIKQRASDLIKERQERAKAQL